MRKTRRTSRVGESVRDALVEVFRFDLKDIDPGMASITGVDVSPDLRLAQVYMSGLDEAETRKMVDELRKRKGPIRSALGRRIHLRYTPELDFRFDETTMRAGRIEAILDRVRQEEPSRESDDDHERTDEPTDDES